MGAPGAGPHRWTPATPSCGIRTLASHEAPASPEGSLTLPPSVLHVLPSLDPRRGGPVTAVIELVAGLREAGVPCAIAVPFRELRRQARVPLVGCAAWRIPLGPVLRLPRTSPLPGPVIVHVHGLASLVPWSPILGRRPWVSAIVATPHGILDWRASAVLRGPKRLWHDRVDVPLLRRLDGLHVTRPSEVMSAQAAVGPTPEATCIPWTLADLPAEASAAVPSPDLAPAAPYLLFVGRLAPIKRIKRLLDAFALMQTNPRPRLLLAGSGDPSYVASLSRHARRLGVRARVEFLGPLGALPLRSLYGNAAALVLPSLYENFGMVVLEAMRAGCPVIAALGTPWGLLTTEGAGRRVDFGDSGAAAAALVEALDPARRRAWGAGARALYEKSFAPSRVIPRFVSWYEKVAAAATPRGSP